MINSSKAVAVGIVAVVLLAGGGYVAATDIGGTNGLQLPPPAEIQEASADGEPGAAEGPNDDEGRSSGAESDAPTGEPGTVDGSDETGSETVTPPPTNAAPSADAGGDQSLREGTVSELDASGSVDSDGERTSRSCLPSVTTTTRPRRIPSTSP